MDLQMADAESQNTTMGNGTTNFYIKLQDSAVPGRESQQIPSLQPEPI